MVIHKDEETIIAQCTPTGNGAIALLRLSGKDVLSVADAIAQLASKKKLVEVPSHTIHYGSVVDSQKKIIDQVLFLIMHGPQTFIGQNVVEITCHNNEFIIQQIINLACENGARLAQNGEFTKRAYLNGKIDLLQAESINELIHASTQMALKNSLSQLKGSFSEWIAGIEKRIVKCSALCEASFEFIDEEMSFGSQILEEINHILHDISQLKNTFDHQQHIKEGVRIALVGSVNAGKSSLFNALLNKKRAIVTSIAGTTRDSIEAGLNLNGNQITCIDTAGIRTTDDVIEQEGINRSFEEAKKADIILLIWDGSRDFTLDEIKIYQELIDSYSEKIILVQNKIDVDAKPHTLSLGNLKPILVSTEQKTNIDKVVTTIDEKIQSLFKDIASPFLLNKRHFSILVSLEKKLKQILAQFSDSVEYELLACHLNDVLQDLSELTGKSISEKSMDAVFKEFCVGK